MPHRSMNKDEIPQRAAGHQRASASITAAFATLPYPTTKQQAVGLVGEWKVPIGEKRVPLQRLLEGMPNEEFETPVEAINAVDLHWGRMIDALGDNKEG